MMRDEFKNPWIDGIVIAIFLGFAQVELAFIALLIKLWRWALN